MSEAKTAEGSTGVNWLAVLLAGLLWLGVILERPAQLSLQVPVRVEHLPTNLGLGSAAPRLLEIRLSGPRILLVKPLLLGGVCSLDLAGAQPGTASYGASDCDFRLDPELKVVRMQPASFQLVLVEVAGAPR